VGQYEPPTETRRLARDAWYFGALGQGGRRLYGALSDTPRTTAMLVAASGLSRATVKRRLAQLVALGLAVRQVDGWRRGVGSLVDTAARLGTLGRSLRQRDTYQRERLAYHAPDALAHRQRQAERRRALAAGVLWRAVSVSFPSCPSFPASYQGQGGETVWRRFVRSASLRRLGSALTWLRWYTRQAAAVRRRLDAGAGIECRGGRVWRRLQVPP